MQCPKVHPHLSSSGICKSRVHAAIPHPRGHFLETVVLALICAGGCGELSREGGVVSLSTLRSSSFTPTSWLATHSSKPSFFASDSSLRSSLGSVPSFVVVLEVELRLQLTSCHPRRQWTSRIMNPLSYATIVEKEKVQKRLSAYIHGTS